MAQTGGALVAIVQTYFAGADTMPVATTRADGQRREVESKDAMNSKAHVAATALQQAVTKLGQEGYTLKSFFFVGG